MKLDLSVLKGIVTPDAAADRVVPPAGFTVWLTLFSSAAMAFLAIFALALSLASGRLAQSWGDQLARASTVQITASAEEMAAQTEAALRVLETTPGIEDARALTLEEQQALLAPWFGPDLPVDILAVPQLIDITETSEGYDQADLRQRLSAEVPGAILDDHTRWRQPLSAAASRLRLIGWVSVLLITLTTGAMITLSANAALAANARVIAVLRLVGATDAYIAGAFVRRFTQRALAGATLGTVLAVICILLMPDAGAAGGLLTVFRFQGWHWIWPLIVPPMAALVALGATQAAARRTLGDLA